MKEIKRICVVGAGAIGSLLVGHLGTLVEATVLTRREEHAAALNKEGMRVSGKSDLHADVLASTNPADLGDVDLVVIATKASAVEASAKTIQGHFSNAHVQTIQNGLGCEEVVSRYGDWPIVSSVTFMSGTRHGDTHVEYELDTATWMGPWAERDASFEFVQQLESLVNRSGLIAEAYEDLLPHQWSKLVFNSAINSIAAVTDLPHVKAFAVQDKVDDLGHLVYNMIDEAKRIAAARGVTLADDPWEMNDRAVNRGSTSGEEYAHIPSMLDDIRAKRLTEIDWITGAIVREAAKAGIPAPYHETMYRLVKAHESSWEKYGRDVWREA
jgi:2-dehydropantoate 2-reductase